MTRRAVTLVELLVALALAGLLGLLVLGLTRGTLRLGAEVEAAVSADGARRVAASLVREAVEAAGRGGLEPALRLELGAAGARGDVVHVARLRDAWHEDPVEARAAFFAGVDSAGRRNLYRRPEGGVKQPLVLGVRALHVVAAVTPEGRTLARSELTDGARLHALRLRLAHGDEVSEDVAAVVRFAPQVRVSRAAP